MSTRGLHHYHTCLKNSLKASKNNPCSKPHCCRHKVTASKLVSLYNESCSAYTYQNSRLHLCQRSNAKDGMFVIAGLLGLNNNMKSSRVGTDEYG